MSAPGRPDLDAIADRAHQAVMWRAAPEAHAVAMRDVPALIAYAHSLEAQLATVRHSERERCAAWLEATAERCKANTSLSDEIRDATYWICFMSARQLRALPDREGSDA